MTKGIESKTIIIKWCFIVSNLYQEHATFSAARPNTHNKIKLQAGNDVFIAVPHSHLK